MEIINELDDLVKDFKKLLVEVEKMMKEWSNNIKINKKKLKEEVGLIELL